MRMAIASLLVAGIRPEWKDAVDVDVTQFDRAVLERVINVAIKLKANP